MNRSDFDPKKAEAFEGKVVDMLILYTISCMHCMSVSFAGRGKEKALEMLKNARFGDIRIKQLSQDIQNYYYITVKHRQ